MSLPMKMNLTKILESASNMRIAVVGDLIIDKYILGTVDRISPEAPVPVLKLTETRENRGGAGNVAENLRGLGVQVSEFYGKHVPIKTRVMAGSQHVIRIDEEEEPYSMKWDEVDIGLGYGIENRKFDVVVISDYGKGMVSNDVVHELIGRCVTHNVPVVVDTKSPLHIFKEATIVKCNNKEWLNYTTSNGIEPWRFCSKYDVEALVITQGHRGIELHHAGYYITPTLSIDVCDPCGAGDTVTAVLAMMQGFKSNAYPAIFKRNIRMAVELANIAASEVCMHPGVVPINKELLRKRFNEVHHA